MKATAKKSQFAEYKNNNPVYSDLLEIEGDGMRKDIAECVNALERRLDTNSKLDKEIFSPKDMLATVILFLGEYITVTE